MAGDEKVTEISIVHDQIPKYGMPPVPVPRHVDGCVLRRFPKDQGNRCSNVYMYIELQEARVSPTGNWIVHLLSQW